MGRRIYNPPTNSGLGVELNEEVAEKHAYYATEIQSRSRLLE